MPELKTIETRYFGVQKRELAPSVKEDGRTIVGYAIVFNQRSRVLYDKTSRKFFEEIIEPRAVTVEFLDRQDIKLVFNHDKNYLLGRSMYGYGTLHYEIDEYGVRFECELPKTAVGEEILELVRRGDLWGCSFSFYYAEDGYVDSRLEDGTLLRTVTKMESINDFSVVVDPAYMGTAVTTRSFEEPKVEPKNEPEETREMESALELEELYQEEMREFS